MVKKFPRKYMLGQLSTENKALKLIIFLHTPRADNQNAMILMSYPVHFKKSCFFIQNLIVNISMPFENLQKILAR